MPLTLQDISRLEENEMTIHSCGIEKTDLFEMASCGGV
jgi:hypothetical protein